MSQAAVGSIAKRAKVIRGGSEVGNTLSGEIEHRHALLPVHLQLDSLFHFFYGYFQPIEISLNALKSTLCIHQFGAFGAHKA